MKRLSTLALATGILALAGATALVHGNPRAAAVGPGRPISQVYDVAYDAGLTRTLYGVPGTISRGDTFIVTGRIYPGGTIPAGGVFNPDTPGSIGTWTCRGVYNFDAEEMEAGAEPMVFTTQVFQFDDGTTIVTEGPEGMATHTRAVTGGTGAAVGALGQVRQEFLGFNETIDVDQMLGMNFRFTFWIRN